MSGDLSGFSMFELFKAEAEAHSAALSDGLLSIEANPDDLSHVEQLMRAAHSIKGAARIVDLDPVVELAHAMEDCFVAVQKGDEKLHSARVDQMLKGVDILQSLCTLPEKKLEDWKKDNAARSLELSSWIRQPVADEVPPELAPSSGQTDEKEAPNASDARVAEPAPGADDVAREPEPPSPDPKTAARPTATTREPEAEWAVQEERTVPVNATNLNRIMRLASESMIEARRLQSMKGSLDRLRDLHRMVSNQIEQLRSDRRDRGADASQLDQLHQLNVNAQQFLQEHSGVLDQVLWKSEQTSTALYHQVIGSRMRPFAEGTQAFPRMIRDLARALGKQVTFEVRGRSVNVDRDILRKLEAPLNHILRNCVDHGIEMPDEREAAGKPAKGRIVLQAHHHAGMLTVQARDDGRGIDPEVIRRKTVQRKLVDPSIAEKLSKAELMEFLFLPGFSTAGQVTEVSGRGVGLDVVRSMVQEVSGTVRAESQLGEGTRFTLRLPVTLSVIRAAIAEIAGEPYAFPLSKLVRIVRVPVDDIQPVQGRQQFLLDGKSVGLISAAELLALEPVTTDDETMGIIVIGQGDQLCGLAVDRFIGEQDLVVRPLDPRLGKVPHILAASVTEAGQPLLIVDIEDLLQAVRQLLGEGRLRGMTSLSAHETTGRRRVLVVDDSITVREVERQLLVGHGYDVDVAVDGQDGWNALRSGSYDLLVTDVDMPRMNGIELIHQVRLEPQLAELPVIIVSYKDREEDRMLGFKAGANAYLTKGSFHDDSFIGTVADLIGEGT